ncbi:MAG: hypothetical protein R2778_11050 [Saprospiraceae bacterium]
MQWEDPNLISGKGVTKPNGTRIYEVCFNTIGDPGTQTDITFDGLGFNIPPDFNNSFAEAYNANGQSIWEESGPNGASVCLLPYLSCLDGSYSSCYLHSCQRHHQAGFYRSV